MNCNKPWYDVATVMELTNIMEEQDFFEKF